MRATPLWCPYCLVGRLIFDHGQRKGIPKYAERLVRQVYSVVCSVGDVGTCLRVVDRDGGVHGMRWAGCMGVQTQWRGCVGHKAMVVCECDTGNSKADKYHAELSMHASCMDHGRYKSPHNSCRLARAPPHSSK